MKFLVAAQMDHRTRQNFKLTSKENYVIGKSVEDAARNVAAKEAGKTAADIYDTALPGPLPN